MKNTLSHSEKFSPKRKFSFFLFFAVSIFISNNVDAVNVTITGPTTVCPNNETPHEFTANAYQIPIGFEVPCQDYVWVVYKDLEIVGGGQGQTFLFTFNGVGNYDVKVTASKCVLFGVFVQGSKTITVNSRVKIPSPISGPSMCIVGQAYTYTSSPDLGTLTDPHCDYHYEYLWKAPQGWKINGLIDTLFTHNNSVNISAPINTPPGSYTISIESSIPKPGLPGQNWFSTPRTYSVQIGPFNSSQISISGTVAVCNGNSYTYTANVPSGHQGNYSYSWTYPSGWTVQSISTNTIKLFVPTYNSSYGAVRVSINNGCGSPSPFTGVTVFPSMSCSYMTLENFKIYPNPSDGEINVTYSDQVKDSLNVNSVSEDFLEEINSIEYVFKIELYNQNEKLVNAADSQLGKVYLDARDLVPGTYFLHIYYGKEVLRKQIQLK